jgi:hypothetical protein
MTPMGEGLVRARRVVGEAVVVGLVALLVTVAMTWPVVLSPNDTAHDSVDPLFIAWSIDWVQHALGGPDTIADGNIYAPNERTHAYSDPLVSLAIALLPFRWAGMSPLGLVNVTLFGAYAMSAAAAYAFGRVTTRRPLIGVCCAVVFAFGPYNTQLAQHAYLAMHAGPAIAAAASWRLAERYAHGGPRWPSLTVLAVTMALNATTSFYLGAFTLVAALTVLTVRWRSLRWRGLASAAAALAAGIVAALPVAWPYLENARKIDGFEWRLGDLGFGAAQFGLVDPSLTLWGGLLGSPKALFTHATFPGATVIALGLLGVGRWIALRRVDEPDTRGFVTALSTAVALVVVGGLLALGADDHGWRQFTPYRLLFDYVPGFGALRAPGRFWIVGLLGCGVLVGAAVQWLVDRFRVTARLRRRRVVPVAAGAVVVGLVLAEGYRPWDNRVRETPAAVDRALADLNTPGGVVYVPMPHPDDGLAVLSQARVTERTTAHHRRTPNGFGGFTPASYGEIARVVARLPDDSALEALRSVGVRFVVVDPLSTQLREPGAASPLRLIGNYDGDLLYELPSR